jgi:hypothetical protein
MRINKTGKAGAEKFVKTCLDEGTVFFDHADVYGDGACEEIFAGAAGMTGSVRRLLEPRANSRKRYCSALGPTPSGGQKAKHKIRGFPKTSVFGEATLDLVEKTSLRAAFSVAFP